MKSFLSFAQESRKIIKLSTKIEKMWITMKINLKEC